MTTTGKRPEITAFAETPSGRIRSFSVDGVEVSVRPHGRDHDGRAEELAEQLADVASGTVCRMLQNERDLEQAQSDLNVARRLIADLTARVPPPAPVRLIGPGCVRFDSLGALWLLGNRERGWSSFGFKLDGWDDLFRRYAVTITEHGTDKHGMWWTAELVGSQ